MVVVHGVLLFMGNICPWVTLTMDNRKYISSQSHRWTGHYATYNSN